MKTLKPISGKNLAPIIKLKVKACNKIIKQINEEMEKEDPNYQIISKLFMELNREKQLSLFDEVEYN